MTTSQNQNLGTDPKSIPCHISRDEEPLFLATKIYLTFLQGLFGQLPHRTYRWDEDPEVSEIVITDQSPVKADDVGRVPHIVTIRGPAQSADLAMDHLIGQNADGTKRQHQDLLNTTISMNCIAREGLVAQRIAYLSWWGIKRYRRLMMRGTHIHETGKQLMLSGETPPGSLVSGDSDPGPVMVSVTSPVYLYDRWAITDDVDEGLILKHLEATFGVSRTEDEPAQQTPAASCGEAPVFNPPTYRGRRLVQVSGLGPAPDGD